MKCKDCIVGYKSKFLGLGVRFIRESDNPKPRAYRQDIKNKFEHCPQCGYRILDPILQIHYPCPISYYFSLSYASYLILPRLFLENMPIAWQHQFKEMLEQIYEKLDIDREYTSEYIVNYRKGGRHAVDPYKDYRRGVISFRKD